jgi:small basic protein
MYLNVFQLSYLSSIVGTVRTAIKKSFGESEFLSQLPALIVALVAFIAAL